MSILDDDYDLNQRYFNNESYFDWLKSFTIDERVHDDERLSYSKLIKQLWKIEFVPELGNDVDRASDGLDLRTRYNDILAKKAGHGEFYTPDVRDIFGKCRVLEMLIALSMRMYDMMQDLGIYNSVSRWFWEIMESLDFEFLDDNNWHDDGWNPTYRFVNCTCEHIMYHDGPYVGGQGGWFRLNNWENMEIWYQMNEYLKPYVMRN